MSPCRDILPYTTRSSEAHPMPPQSRTTRAQTKKRPPQTTKTARKATQAVPKATQVAPKARTRRPQVAPEAAPAPAQDAPASAPSNAPRILPAEASPAFDQSLPESTSSGPTERQAPDIEEVHFTAPDGT